MWAAATSREAARQRRNARRRFRSRGGYFRITKIYPAKTGTMHALATNGTGAEGEGGRLLIAVDGRKRIRIRSLFLFPDLAGSSSR